MPKFISLVKFTSKGIENIKESPNRLDNVKELCNSMGIKIEGFYLTMGRYDVVYIVDAPDSETAAKCLLTIGSKGSITSETLLAFPEDDYRTIIADVL